jgi:hypothetical protein
MMMVVSIRQVITYSFLPTMIKDDSWRVIDPKKRVYLMDYLENMTPLSTRSKESSHQS